MSKERVAIMKYLIVLLLMLTTGCSSSTSAPVQPSDIPHIVEVNEMTDFNSELNSYLKSNGYEDENYMFSNVSLRYAVALAALGADGETKQELIEGIGFQDESEMLSWISSIDEEIKKIDDITESSEQWYSKHGIDFTPSVLKINNSIWHNKSKKGTFTKDYKSKVSSVMDAKVAEVPAKDLKDSINNWVFEETNNLIPILVDDKVQDSNTILVNTVYLKDSFVNDFDEMDTEELDFTTKSGEVVKKDMMHSSEDMYDFYKEGDKKLLRIDMSTGCSLVLTLGHFDDLNSALGKTEFINVDVHLPKFEVDTSLDNQELKDFLKSKNVSSAFDFEKADFSKMMNDNALYIDDILQKTKIKVDEKGLEAAAATAMMMTESAIMIDKSKIEEFNANKPFEFYIVLPVKDSYEVLFSGQYVK